MPPAHRPHMPSAPPQHIVRAHRDRNRHAAVALPCAGELTSLPPTPFAGDSSPVNASSSSRRRGDEATARASATRCCSPPDSMRRDTLPAASPHVKALEQTPASFRYALAVRDPSCRVFNAKQNILRSQSCAGTVRVCSATPWRSAAGAMVCAVRSPRSTTTLLFGQGL